MWIVDRQVYLREDGIEVALLCFEALFFKNLENVRGGLLHELRGAVFLDKELVEDALDLEQVAIRLSGFLRGAAERTGAIESPAPKKLLPVSSDPVERCICSAVRIDKYLTERGDPFSLGIVVLLAQCPCKPRPPFSGSSWSSG